MGKGPESWDHVHCISVDDILTLWKSTEKCCWLEWELNLHFRDTSSLLYMSSYQVHRNWRWGLSSVLEKVSVDHIVFAISQVPKDIRGSSKWCLASVRVAQIVGGCFGLVKNQPSPCQLLQWKNWSGTGGEVYLLHSRKLALIILCLQFVKLPKISMAAASGVGVVLGCHKLSEDVFLDLLKINHLLVNYYNGKI